MKRAFTALIILSAAILFAVLIQQNNAGEQRAIAENTSNQKSKPVTDPFSEWFDKKTKKKKAGHAKADQPEMHALIQRQMRTRSGEKQPAYGPNQVMEEFLKAKQRAFSAAARTESLDFIERGPGNVAGRTRALVVDPDDPDQETFYAGSASGGIWKTTNAGESWTYLSSDIPNLGTNTLAMAPSNTSVIYAGTGEHFTTDIDGSGMFKSTDKGNSWTQIADPADMPDFKNVSRIVVDPNDENTVIATTRSTVWGDFSAAIYKSTDGGSTWTRLRSSTSERYDDIDYDPSDFNTLYVAIDEKGVIKSTDGGITWQDASKGMSPGGRIEITISPVDNDRIWASAQGTLSGSGSDLYVSNDGGGSWLLVVDEEGDNVHFLGGQGWYDNIITAHPYDADKVYVGGVNTFLFELLEGDADSVTIIKPVEYGSETFMSFINFGGGFLGGGMDLGGVEADELLPVEVRFGAGTQKAHRFTVGGAGPGVPAGDYVYEDYVEVPFQVWDTKNNVQLMASFRDQQEDGAWNLIASNTEGATADHSREYLYVHNIPYSDTAADTIAVDGGHENGQMYFFWPVLASGATFDASNLPASELAVEFQVTPGVLRETSVVSDAYGDFSGPNQFPQTTREAGLHPDQHNIVIYDKNDNDQTFRLLTGNDGGVYRSVSSTLPGPNEGDYEFISYGFNTTQFYGADKAPGQNRYIGGTQDNGTWYNPAGTEGSPSAEAVLGIGGDGFEALWHSADPDKIIGGLQFNGIYRTLDGGTTWRDATSGLTGDGPFITRLSHHKQQPDRLFTLTSEGVFVSQNFGGQWSRSSMTDADLWSFNSSADVEVSYANPDVVWAGGNLEDELRLHVSVDGGETFNATGNYADEEMGFVSGIGTHPTEENTAYALFSFAGLPKVLKTTDLGQTWTDISGFDGTGDRGFPDVAINCLYVFPTDVNRIWVGSEIGIIESLDGGASWNLYQSNLPPVNIYDFKLSDDQLVIATYGRGIWSVALEGIVIAPTVEKAYMTPSGELKFNLNFAQDFDSAFVYVDEDLLGNIENTSKGIVSASFSGVDDSGDLSVKLEAYLDGQKYSSVESSIFVFGLKEEASSFGTDFSGAFVEFHGSGFNFRKATGFSSIAMHSQHPYEDEKEIIYYLKTPITVASSDAFFRYRDIAIIETGEEGTAFGDVQFWDYVVVEATNDGLNWIPLEEGYDASLYADWEAAYDAGDEATPDMYKDHDIDLLGPFEAGDLILIRFRLYADELTNGYGWVVDDLYIQEQPLSAEDPGANVLRIYPNPVKESATFRFADQTPEHIQIISLNGSIVDQLQVAPGTKEVTWQKKNLTEGIYIARYMIEGKSYSRKLFVE
jgi:photosystem II stability/assembly factor-like uncharacterized protein